VGKTCPGTCEKTTKQKKPESIKVGHKAPLFTLKDGKGKTYSIEDSLRMNKRIVLFFYPKGESSLSLSTRTHTHTRTPAC